MHRGRRIASVVGVEEGHCGFLAHRHWSLWLEGLARLSERCAFAIKTETCLVALHKLALQVAEARILDLE